MDGGPAGRHGSVVVVTASRASGEALAFACRRRGREAKVIEPRGAVPADAAVVVFDLTSSAATVAAFAERVGSPTVHRVAVADTQCTPVTSVPVDAWVDVGRSVDEFVAIVVGQDAIVPPPSTRGARDAVEVLTTREQQVLQELMAGDGTPEVAARLDISEHTVRKHLQNVLSKLGVSSRAEAAAWAIRQGFGPFERSGEVGS